MDTPTSAERPFTLVGVAVYTAMVAVAAVAGWWWSIDLWQPAGSESPRSLPDFVRAAALGLAATIPLILLLLAFDRWPPRLLRRLKSTVDDDVVPLLAELSVVEFLLLSIAAGIGEELLFRGLLQNGLAWLLTNWQVAYPLAISVVLAAVVFGVCHWFNWEYALVAAVVGVYLGWLFIATNNLVAPMVAHAAYDFVALCYLVRYKQRTRRKA
jgi:membrane protease YdiL (CAAX protease family)